MRDVDEILKNIIVEKAEKIKLMYRQRLISDKELNAIDPRLVDLPNVKRDLMCPVCIDQPMQLTDDKQKVLCVRCKGEKQKIQLEPWLLKPILKAMSHYHSIVNSRVVPVTRDGIRSWEMKRVKVDYKLTDINFTQVIRGSRVHLSGRPMIGVVLKHGPKIRYLLNAKDLQRVKEEAALRAQKERSPVEGFVVEGV